MITLSAITISGTNTMCTVIKVNNSFEIVFLSVRRDSEQHGEVDQASAPDHAGHLSPEKWRRNASEEQRFGGVPDHFANFQTLARWEDFSVKNEISKNNFIIFWTQCWNPKSRSFLSDGGIKIFRSDLSVNKLTHLI